jgi:hypothetical protein
MNVKILKELVGVYIRWREDNPNINRVLTEYCYLYPIKGIDEKRLFIKDKWIVQCKNEEGWIGANLEIGQLYILDQSIEPIFKTYIVVPENREPLVMNYEEAFNYFMVRLESNKKIWDENK